MSHSGCKACWSSSATEAWEAVIAIPIETQLIDESHFAVIVRACPSCSQRFLQVFTEMIDWEDGQDPMEQTIIPIDDAERARLLSRQPLDIDTINAVGPDRRSLRFDWPKGKSQHIFWGVGMYVGRYD